MEDERQDCSRQEPGSTSKKTLHRRSPVSINPILSQEHHVIHFSQQSWREVDTVAITLQVRQLADRTQAGTLCCRITPKAALNVDCLTGTEGTRVRDRQADCC